MTKSATPLASKIKQREALAKDVERFLAQGGAIKQIPFGHSGKDKSHQWHYFKLAGTKYSNGTRQPQRPTSKRDNKPAP